MMLRSSVTSAAASLSGRRAGTLAAAHGGCGATASAAPARPCTSAHPRLLQPPQQQPPQQGTQRGVHVSARAAMGAASAAPPRSPAAAQESAKRGIVAAAASSPAPSGAAPSDAPDVRELAKMAQIGMTEQEAADWQPKINSIIDWFGQLQQVDVSGVQPAVHASDEAAAAKRPDVPTLNAAHAQLIGMAPGYAAGYVKVPKISTGADAEAASAAEVATAPSAAAAPAAAAGGGPPAASPAAAAAAAPPAATEGASAGVEASANPNAPPTKEELAAFGSVALLVGRILECEPHPDADTLYIEKIDVGEPEPRTIVSGLRKYVPVEQMVGRLVIVAANLKPRNMRGIKSAGMVLAASTEGKTQVVPVLPPAGASVGTRVWLQPEDASAAPAPASPNAVEKKKLWEKVAGGLKTDGNGSVTWKGTILAAGGGAVSGGGLVNARVA